MNGEGYQELQATVDPLGYVVEPMPAEGEQVQFFDITSEGGEIRPQVVLNVLHQAAQSRGLSVQPGLLTAQPHCLTFEDMSV